MQFLLGLGKAPNTFRPGPVGLGGGGPVQSDASPLGGVGGQRSPIEQFFGPLGSPQSGLQRFASTGIQQFLNASPPGQETAQALQPHFQRNLDLANQQGGRFGSANAIMRTKALEDFNLLTAQAAQQDMNRRLQGLQVAGMLGQQEAQQADIETQRRLAILLQQLGAMQQATLGAPVQTSPSGFQQGSQLGGSIGSILAYLLGPGSLGKSGGNG